MQKYGIDWQPTPYEHLWKGSEADVYNYENIFELWEIINTPDNQLFVGCLYDPSSNQSPEEQGFLSIADPWHFLYLAMDLKPTDIVEIFHVGAHNNFSGDTPAQCQQIMKKLFERYPYRVYFADSAGFKVQFINQISMNDARWIAENCVIGDEIYPTCEEENWSEAPCILEENGLQIWFD